MEDCSGAGEGLDSHAIEHHLELGLVPFDDPAGAEETEDARRGEERAEHDGNASILVDMADGLVAGAGDIDIGSFIGAQDGKRCGRQSLRRKIDVTTCDWGGSDEEDGLVETPFGEVIVEGRVVLDHVGGFAVVGEFGDSEDEQKQQPD